MENNSEIRAENIWDEKKIEGLKDFILARSNEQSKERKLRNELLSIQYKIEDYIENDGNDPKLRILDFVKMYLKT